jgi:glutamate transport system permease protein
VNLLADHWDLFWTGFKGTLVLSLWSGLLALTLGTVMAGFRVSPVPPLRAFGTAWVTVLRNTPLVLLFFIAFLALPRLGVTLDTLPLSVLAVGCYTSAFICEAIRSGINTVPMGQAEAARSLGMTFSQSLSTVILPQAIRTAVVPMGSLIIAMIRNTAIAAGFGYVDLLSTKDLLLENGENVLWIFFWIAVAYLVMTVTLSALLAVLEKKLAVVR